MNTATEPGGVVHLLNQHGDLTICGLSAISWSRAVTIPQMLGIVVFCPICEARNWIGHSLKSYAR